MSWDPDLRRCTHDRVVLVEGGYEREWEWHDNGDGTYTATEDYPASFGDEGNGEHHLRCKSCLTSLPLPDDWEEGVDFQ
jgi:hypothetical protein